MPKSTLNLSKLEARRARRYRQKLQLRCRNADDIRAFVDDVGIAFLFPVQGVEMPNVYQAVAGFDKDTTPKHNDPHISLTWNTKDRTLDKRWWYYGKLIRDKATLLSFDMLAAFYALSENFGDPDDYLEEYRAGRLSADAKNIYEALLHDGAMHAIALKRAVGLYGDAAKGRFDKAMNELQRGLKILPVGVAEAGAWKYAFIYEVLWRWLPDTPTQASKLSRADARAQILERHLRNVIWAAPKEISRTFGWKPKETQAAAEALIGRGSIAAGAFADAAGDVWVSREVES